LQLPDFWHYRLQVVQPVINVSPVMALAVLHWVHWLVVQSQVAAVARSAVRQSVVPPAPLSVLRPITVAAATAPTKIATANVIGRPAVATDQLTIQRFEQAGSSACFHFEPQFCLKVV
jgi:hypothetical protein